MKIDGLKTSMKGEQGKPNIGGKKGSGKGKNVSSENERKKREEKKKESRKARRKISQSIEPKYVKSIPPYCPLMPNTEAMNLSLCRKS